MKKSKIFDITTICTFVILVIVFMFFVFLKERINKIHQVIEPCEYRVIDTTYTKWGYYHKDNSDRIDSMLCPFDVYRDLQGYSCYTYVKDQYNNYIEGDSAYISSHICEEYDKAQSFLDSVKIAEIEAKKVEKQRNKVAKSLKRKKC